MAPDFERLARMPCPMACWASSGTSLLSSALACSCSRCADRVREKTAANSAQAFEELMSTMRTASMRGLRRLDAEQGRGLATLDAAPELPLGGNDEVLVERIGMGLDLHPLAAAGDHRKHRTSGRHDPHIVLQLRHIFFRRRFLRERPWQHELALEHVAAFDPTVEGCRHPAEGSDGGPTAGRL